MNESLEKLKSQLGKLPATEKADLAYFPLTKKTTALLRAA